MNRTARPIPGEPTRATTPALLTLTELARLLRCSKAQASKITRGLIPGVAPLPVIRLGRRVIIRQESLIDWLSQQDWSSVVR